jgi:hypothetical protein
MLGGYCRGQPRGSPKKTGGSCLKPAKKHKTQTRLEQNTKHMHTAQPTPRWPPRPTKAAQQGAPSSKVCLARELTPPSSEVCLARGSPPPSSGLRLARGSLTSAPAPARGYKHLMLWHSRAAPSRAWESRPGAVSPTP